MLDCAGRGFHTIDATISRTLAMIHTVNAMFGLPRDAAAIAANVTAPQ
jgi:hypothetical protein